TFAGLVHAVAPLPNGHFSEDLARAALTIGALKLSGLFAKQVTGLEVVRARGLPLQGVVSQSSALFGLMVAHRAEQKLGLRPIVNGETFLLDSLASLVTLGAGANLGKGTLGEGFAEYQNELGLRTKMLEAKPQAAIARPDLSGLTPAVAGNAMGGRPLD